MDPVVSVHKDFNLPDADVIIQSSDKIQFHLHRKELAAHKEAFPEAGFGIAGETVLLKEPASVLEVLFRFIYPNLDHDQASLQLRGGKLDQLVVEIDKAAQKYEVADAKLSCKEALSRLATDKKYAIDVFIYCRSQSEEYGGILNAAASKLASSCDAFEVAERLPDKDALIWLKYHKQRHDKIFKAAEDWLDRALASNYCVERYKTGFSSDGICDPCHACLSLWLRKIKINDRTGGASALRTSLQPQNISYYPNYIKHGPHNRSKHCGCETEKDPPRCQFVYKLAELCTEGLNQVWSYTGFLAELGASVPQPQ
ncbi:hypothetical protein CPB83DRAFT_859470 [Crepidotus variabilis]|uniref:BTB domain-containing protein n=1 Tax=Crepidotus variabilis TaxID=179855 RepID=A0A9P6EAE0_9AGAR|nr:hypothetical protein CPB83DRAFT_859470 [Crepidotus variabilis]